MKRYELVDHTADIAIKAFGDTLADAFAAAAEAMFDIIVDGAEIRSVRKTQLRVESIDREGLLVNFLSELIVIHEVERLVLHDFSVSFFSRHSLCAEGWGEEFDQSRHRAGVHIKGVSYHMMDIREGDSRQPSCVQVLFDV